MKLKNAFTVLSDPNITPEMLLSAFPSELKGLEDQKIAQQLKIESTYSNMLAQQAEHMDEVRRNENLILPEDLDYSHLRVANEAKSKLAMARPRTLAAASRIQGVTPAALVLLLNHVKRQTSKL